MHRLSIGPCARHCCYGSCINGKEEPARLMRSTPEWPTPISTHQFGAVSTHRQAAAISSLYLEPPVVACGLPALEGFLPVRS